MCTATFLPLSKTSFVLTHNRDEHMDRKTAILPMQYEHFQKKLVYPKDATANGTWFIASESTFAICLLNGAFTKHIAKPPYAKSRGLVPIEFFEYNNVQEFINNYSFSNIEPFTLIIVESTDAECILQVLRWDAHQLHLEALDASKAHIWSSATLYNAQQVHQREEWFHTWLTQYLKPTAEDIIQFHKFGPASGQEGFIIDRPDNKITVSLTCLHRVNNHQSNMQYQDLVMHTGNTINW